MTHWFRVVFLSFGLVVTSYAQSDPVVSGALLAESSFSENIEHIQSLENRPGPEIDRLFEIWLAGNLAYWSVQNRLVEAVKEGRTFQLFDLHTAAALGEVKGSALRRVKANNSIRSALQAAIGIRQLSAFHASDRLQAIQALMRTPDIKLLDGLLAREGREEDPEVLSRLHILIGLVQIQSPDPADQRAGLARLNGVLDAEVRNALNALLLRPGNDPMVVAEATEVLSAINRELQLWGIGQNIVFGVSLGSVLLLAAIGLAITFGVMGVINMAHGEFIMIGAYTSFVMQQLFPTTIEWNLVLSIPAAFIVSALFGVLLERSIIRHLYGRPLETLLATFGVSLILQQLVRSVFGPLNQSVVTPAWLSGGWTVNAAFAVTYNRLFVIGFAFVILGGLWLIMQRTAFGMHIRAVTMNRGMAASMGIPTRTLDALAFGLGSGIAGMAGVALAQLTNVGPNLGQSYIIDSFMVVVFGGVGNLMGTVVAALSLGVANKLMEPWVGAVVAKILILVFIVLFIQKRPRGLFALKGRSVED